MNYTVYTMSESKTSTEIYLYAGEINGDYGPICVFHDYETAMMFLDSKYKSDLKSKYEIESYENCKREIEKGMGSLIWGEPNNLKRYGSMYGDTIELIPENQTHMFVMELSSHYGLVHTTFINKSNAISNTVEDHNSQIEDDGPYDDTEEPPARFLAEDIVKLIETNTCTIGGVFDDESTYTLTKVKLIRPGDDTSYL